MRTEALSKYLSRVPCVLCTKVTRIEALNLSAADEGKLHTGNFLSDFMSPIDVLRLEAALRCSRPLPPVVFPTDVLRRDGVAAAYTEEIFGRIFAVIAFYENAAKCSEALNKKCIEKCSRRHLAGVLAKDLADIPDGNFFNVGDVRLFDVRRVIGTCFSDIAAKCPGLDCDISVGNTDAEKEFLCPDLGSFMMALSLILFVMNGISSDKKIGVSLSGGPQPCLDIFTATDMIKMPCSGTEDMAESLPRAGYAVTLCEYFAGCSALCVSAHGNGDGKIHFSLRKIDSEFPEIEFKYRDDKDGYVESVMYAAKLFEALSSLCQQE